MRSSNSQFSASLTKGSLKVVETRLLAGLLLSGCSPNAALLTAVEQNLMQKRSASTSRTFGSFLLRRLNACPSELHQILAQGSLKEATQAAFVSALAESALLRAFMQESVGSVLTSGRRYLSHSDWLAFKDWLETQDSSTSGWSDGAWAKLRQNCWRILAEVELVDSTKSMRIQPLILEESIKALLNDPKLEKVMPSLLAAGVK